MGQIATKAFCNELHSGAFTGDTTQCPTRSQIESAGFTIIGGSYTSDQCVQQEHIGYDWTEYTFSVSPSSITISNQGGSESFTVTSYGITYRNSSSGTNIQINKFAVDYTTTKSGPASVSKGSVSSSTYTATYTVSLEENNTPNSVSGTVTFTQNTSGYTDTGSYYQDAADPNWGPIRIISVTVNDIPASGGSISGGIVTYEQDYGYGDSNTGYTSTSGAYVTWGDTVIAESLGTTTADREKVGTITVTVSRGGYSDSAEVDVYQARNQRYTGSTSWGSWSRWYVSLDVSTTTFGSYGGTANVTGSAYRYRSGTINYTYDSGSTSTSPTTDIDEVSSISVSSNQSWASLNSTTTSCTLTVGSYSEDNTRTAIITGSYGGYSDTVTISQNGLQITYGNYKITVSPHSDTHSAKGEEETEVTIKATRDVYYNGSYYTTEDTDWVRTYERVLGFSVSGDRTGTGSGTNTIKSTSYTLNESISITVTYSCVYDSSVSDSITVTQAANVYTYTFEVSPTSLSWDYNSTTSKDIEVKSSRQGTNGTSSSLTWTTEYDLPWISLTPSSAYGDSTVSCYPRSNNDGARRSGIITFIQDESGYTIELTVTQGPVKASYYRYDFLVDPTSLSFNAIGGNLGNLTVLSDRIPIQVTGDRVAIGFPEQWNNWSGDITQGEDIFFKTNDTTIRAYENLTSEARNGMYTLTQEQPNKFDSSCPGYTDSYASDPSTIDVSLSQDAAEIERIYDIEATTKYTGNVPCDGDIIQYDVSSTFTSSINGSGDTQYIDWKCESTDTNVTATKISNTTASIDVGENNSTLSRTIYVTFQQIEILVGDKENDSDTVSLYQDGKTAVVPSWSYVSNPGSFPEITATLSSVPDVQVTYYMNIRCQDLSGNTVYSNPSLAFTFPAGTTKAIFYVPAEFYRIDANWESCSPGSSPKCIFQLDY